MRRTIYTLGAAFPDYRLDRRPAEDPECPECGHEMGEEAYGEVYRCRAKECGHIEALPEDPRISECEEGRY
jgi:tRNA(Ile2) C34 agmatinyltransferase TiaS